VKKEPRTTPTGPSRGVLPTVTMLVTTYNRASTLGRALDSILQQTYPHIDLLVIDDGSSDNTKEVLQRFRDKRVRVIWHGKNRGTTAARNTGLDNIRGEWFTFLDSDDELVPDALESLLDVPLRVDPTVNKVECNGRVYGSDQWTGHGLDHDQYLNEATAFTRMREDFWGITRTDLLGSDRFNEHLRGYENLLWSRIRDRAKEYYLHKPLLINHREGVDRLSQPKQLSDQEMAALYRQLLDERHWWSKLSKYKRGEFQRQSLKGFLVTLSAGDVGAAKQYRQIIAELSGNNALAAVAGGIGLLGPTAARVVYSAFRAVKRG
jgi:glycosyltransferase involved in cell wall biosynthesis